MSQGQGKGTPKKERHFATAIHVSFDISEPVRSKPYFHCDLNAGEGFNEKIGCEGSPLVFLRQAEAAKRRVFAFFCDHNQKLIDKLEPRTAPWKEEGRLAPGSRFRCFACDNAEMLHTFARFIESMDRPEYATGTVLCDPNGYNDMPLDSLADFARRFPRMDIIWNLNCSFFATIFNGEKGCCRHPKFAPQFRHILHPRDIINRLGRTHWLISQPAGGSGHGGQRFSVLVGRNTRIGHHCYEGFWPLESPTGRKIFEGLKRVEVGQLYLPFPVEAKP